MPFLIMVFSIKLAAQTERSKQLTANLVDAINALDTQKIISLLDDSCMISSLPRGMNERVIPLIFNEKFVKIANYKITKEVKDSLGLRVFLEVNYANGKPGKPDFVFNKAGKVVQFNIINIKKPEHKSAELKPALKGILPDKVLLPFELSGGLIFVPTKIDGKDGWLQFDSGSAFTILNQADFPSKDSNSVRTTVTGINGVSNLRQYNADSILLGNLKLENFATNTMANVGQDGSFGLLGFDIFRDYELILDYQNQTIELNKTDSIGNYLNNNTELGKPIYIAKIVMQRHIPIIKLTVGKKQYAMGLDCGANSNLFFNENYQLLKNKLKEETAVDMGGLGDKTIKVKSAILSSASVGKLTFTNMETVFTHNNMGNANTSEKLNIDGILGYPFLKQYKIAVNFKKQSVSFFKNSR